MAAGLFALLSLALGFALKQSSQVWLSNSSHQDATQLLRKASTRLEAELSMASTAQLSTTTVPASLSSGGFDGDAVWFLSHINPYDGEAYLKSDGSPFWQCNVLYYTVIPQNVNDLNGGPVTGGVDPDGYESRCTHKVLIRKVIDLAGPSDPNDESTEETLLTDPTPYLTRPTAFDLPNMQSEVDVVKAEPITSGLLFFRARVRAAPKGVEFDIRALSRDEARRVARVTGGSMLDSQYTLQNRLFVSARN